MARFVISVLFAILIATPLLNADEMADAVLKEVADTYRKARTYRDRPEIVIEISMKGTETKFSIPYEIKVKKPDKISVRSDSHFSDVNLVSDGKNIWNYNKRANEYTKEKALSLHELTKDRTGPLGMMKSPVLLSTILADDPLADISEGVKSKRLLEAEIVDGRECDVIELEQLPSKVKLWVDKERKIVVKLHSDMGEAIKRAQADEGESPMSMKITEYHRDITLDGEISDEEFTFSPPEGAKLVSEFTVKKKKKRPRVNLEGEPAPDFTLKDLNGKEYSLKKIKGKVVLINFWAMWCPPCRKELPHIQKIHEELGPEGLLVLGINSEKDEAKLKKFIKEKKITFPVLRDTERAASKAYKVSAIPRVLIIDREGTIKADFTGLGTEEEFKKALAAVGITSKGKEKTEKRPKDPS